MRAVYGKDRCAGSPCQTHLHRLIHFPQRIDGFLPTGRRRNPCKANTHAGDQGTNNAGFMVADEKEREHRANGYAS